MSWDFGKGSSRHIRRIRLPVASLISNTARFVLFIALRPFSSQPRRWPQHSVCTLVHVVKLYSQSACNSVNPAYRIVGMELICLQPPNPLRRNLCPLRQLIWSQPFLCPQLADSDPKTAVMLLLIAFK